MLGILLQRTGQTQVFIRGKIEGKADTETSTGKVRE